MRGRLGGRTAGCQHGNRAKSSRRNGSRFHGSKNRQSASGELGGRGFLGMMQLVLARSRNIVEAGRRCRGIASCKPLPFSHARPMVLVHGAWVDGPRSWCRERQLPHQQRVCRLRCVKKVFCCCQSSAHGKSASALRLAVRLCIQSVSSVSCSCSCLALVVPVLFFCHYSLSTASSLAIPDSSKAVHAHQRH